MDSTQKEKIIFRNLIAKSIDGLITEGEVLQFNTMLSNCQGLQDYYVKCVQLHAALCEIQEFNASEINDSPLMDEKVWLEMAEYEKTANKILVPKQKEKTELIQKVVYTKTQYHFSKFSLYSFILSLAALLLIALFIQFAPDRSGKKVATLVESLNAQWGESAVGLKSGVRLVAGMESLVLREGLVRVTYDSGASVVIEAPAEFMVSADDELELYHGKLYATVPSEAIGFSVNTTNARIIDLGTEFGIDTPIKGDAELHVFKGKTSLISGFSSPGHSRICLDVVAGQARRVHPENSNIEEIELKSNVFARTFDHQTGGIWRGEPLCLANIVAGGNGFTGGDVKSCIDPSSGIIYPEPLQGIDNTSSDSYVAVKDRPFIDGVFVPNGGRGVNQLTSAGHTFKGFPETEGLFYAGISANPYVIEIQGKEADSSPKEEVVSKLTPVSLDETIMNRPCIFLHANAGITFDLNQLRQANPGFDLTAFTAVCHSASVWEKKSEFWVFLDGVLVFHCTADEARQKKQTVDVPIRESHKFLTLATTDGQDKTVYDWCLFTEPQITLASVPHERNELSQEAK